MHWQFQKHAGVIAWRLPFSQEFLTGGTQTTSSLRELSWYFLSTAVKNFRGKKSMSVRKLKIIKNCTVVLIS